MGPLDVHSCVRRRLISGTDEDSHGLGNNALLVLEFWREQLDRAYLGDMHPSLLYNRGFDACSTSSLLHPLPDERTSRTSVEAAIIDERTSRTSAAATIIE